MTEGGKHLHLSHDSEPACEQHCRQTATHKVLEDSDILRKRSRVCEYLIENLRELFDSHSSEDRRSEFDDSEPVAAVKAMHRPTRRYTGPRTPTTREGSRKSETTLNSSSRPHRKTMCGGQYDLDFTRRDMGLELTQREVRVSSRLSLSNDHDVGVLFSVGGRRVSFETSLWIISPLNISSSRERFFMA